MINVDLSHLRHLQSIADDFVTSIKPKYLGKEVRLLNSKGYGKQVIVDMYIRKGELHFKINTYLLDGKFAGFQVSSINNIIWLDNL